MYVLKKFDVAVNSCTKRFEHKQRLSQTNVIVKITWLIVEKARAFWAFRAFRAHAKLKAVPGTFSATSGTAAQRSPGWNPPPPARLRFSHRGPQPRPWCGCNHHRRRHGRGRHGDLHHRHDRRHRGQHLKYLLKLFTTSLKSWNKVLFTYSFLSFLLLFFFQPV